VREFAVRSLTKHSPHFLHIFQAFSPQTQHLDRCSCQVLAGFMGYWISWFICILMIAPHHVLTRVGSARKKAFP
jgi:hypothetical protein